MNNVIPRLVKFAGINSNKTNKVEKIVSGVGGFTGIFLILIITRYFVEDNAAALVVASMGASAVLLFAVPHGPLSQPWALIGGHLISAFIGVSCYFLIPDLYIAAALAVGLAITAMYYLRCIHPPGGATALTAVVAGSSVHELGYMYILTPVLLNVIVIFTVAVAFNFFFKWRRYPVSIMQYKDELENKNTTEEKMFTHEDIQYALRKMNLFVDVQEDELERIYQLASNHKFSSLVHDKIKLGMFYSNGKYGNEWSVRQVVDESGNPDPEKDEIIYKVVAGKDKRQSKTVSRKEFAEWAKYEVWQDEQTYSPHRNKADKGKE